MERIAIITDSVADLPTSYLEENNIYMVRLYVVIDSQYYKDGVDITTADINRLNKENSDFTARTSAPSPTDFADTFKQVREDGFDKAIYIGINPKLSGTLASAKIANTHGLDLTIIDSGSVTIVEGLLVVYANNLVKAGLSYDEVVSRVEAAVGKQKVYGWLNTLRNLKASGRLGRAATKVTTLLNLKPLLSVDGAGDFDLIKLKVSRDNSYKLLEKHIRKDLEECGNYYLAYIYGGDESFLDEIKERLADLEANASEVITSQFGSTISTHAGPKTYGVAYLKL